MGADSPPRALRAPRSIPGRRRPAAALAWRRTGGEYRCAGGWGAFQRSHHRAGGCGLAGRRRQPLRPGGHGLPRGAGPHGGPGGATNHPLELGGGGIWRFDGSAGALRGRVAGGRLQHRRPTAAGDHRPRAPGARPRPVRGPPNWNKPPQQRRADSPQRRPTWRSAAEHRAPRPQPPGASPTAAGQRRPWRQTR